MDGAVIESRRLRIGYGRRTVVDDIDLAVAGGEVLCLLGPNGSGKTTLFRTLLGLQPPLEGTVDIAGRPLAGLSRRDVARTVAYVPQSQESVFAYRVLDSVLMGRTAHLGLFATPGADDIAKSLDALHAFGIADLAQADLTSLSGGQRQLVMIARALAQDASAIVLDEPTANLDLGNRVRVLETIRRLADRGIAVVLSTHDPEHALAIADTVILLADGAVAGHGPCARVLTAAALRAVYRVPVALERTESGRLVVVSGPGPRR